MLSTRRLQQLQSSQHLFILLRPNRHHSLQMPLPALQIFSRSHSPHLRRLMFLSRDNHNNNRNHRYHPRYPQEEVTGVVKDLGQGLVDLSMIIMMTMRIIMKPIIMKTQDQEEEGRDQGQDPGLYMMMNTMKNTKLEEDVDLEEGRIEVTMIVDL